MKKAFTTAELLISLIVIGVIAALVIPVFTKDYNTRIRAAAIKDTYATLMSAIQRACADKNVTYFSHTGYMGSKASLEEFLKKYLRGKIESAGSSKFNNKYSSISNPKPSGQGLTDGPKDSSYAYFTMQNGGMLAMTCRDGKLMHFKATSGYNVPTNEGEDTQRYCTFYIDTNGRFAPNIGGIDMFTFHIGSYSNNVAIQSSTLCKSSALGENCVYQLIRNDWNIDNLANESVLNF